MWKGPFVDNSIMRNLTKKRQITKTWSRRSTILPEFVDKTFEIHNGVHFMRLKINEDMIGHKFGEFIFTRKRHIRKAKK